MRMSLCTPYSQESRSAVLYNTTPLGIIEDTTHHYSIKDKHLFLVTILKRQSSKTHGHR